MFKEIDGVNNENENLLRASLTINDNNILITTIHIDLGIVTFDSAFKNT